MSLQQPAIQRGTAAFALKKVAIWFLSHPMTVELLALTTMAVLIAVSRGLQ